jgi:hypothetical protein
MNIWTQTARMGFLSNSDAFDDSTKLLSLADLVMEKEFLTVHINSRKSIHFGGVIESHHESDKSETRRDQN